MPRILIPLLLLAALGGAACSDDDTPSTSDEPTSTAAPTREATFEVVASAEQVTVTGAQPGATLRLDGPSVTIEDVADEAGNLIFRDVPAGGEVTVTEITDGGPAVSDPVEVLRLDEHPPATFYETQDLGEGFGYLRTRDGTLLAVNVILPGPVEEGPYPTVIEYSGYDPANPGDPEPTSVVATQVGFAVVGVNMRGTGCSGGAFDYFEPLQALDGYDAVEVVAAQPWVLGHRVGMVGVSYPGISQLFVAATRPPSLAAITPLSVIEDVYRSVLYPGGIYNDGFAQQWAASRQDDTEAGGEAWVRERIEGGDTTCEANQQLRSQNTDLVGTARATPYYDPARLDRLAPRTFVDRIEVPVLLAGAWQDEQTGGRFATMLDDFDSAPVLRVFLYNGAHADSLSPEVLLPWYEFLNLYVADRVPPPLDPVLRAAAPLLYQGVFGATGLELPPDRFDGVTDLAEARARFEADPPVTVLLEMGADDRSPGGPLPRGRLELSAWPPPDATARSWSLVAGGGLVDGEPSAASPATGGDAEVFRVDAEDAHETQTAPADDPNPYDSLSWPVPDPGTALAYETAPLDEDLVVAGSGSVTLLVGADAPDVDLEVTLSEVRPDGQEAFVQSGWLRASARAIDPTESTELLPFHTFTEADAELLPEGAFVPVDIEIFPVTHVFRAGSRLRITVDTPGGSRNLWTFDILDTDGVPVRIAPAGSTLRLPVLDGVEVPDGPPACPGLRSQPCRPVPEIVNATEGILP